MGAKGRVAQSGNIQSVRHLEAIVLDLDEVISPLLWVGRYHPQWKLLICPLSL